MPTKKTEEEKVEGDGVKAVVILDADVDNPDQDSGSEKSDESLSDMPVNP